MIHHGKVSKDNDTGIWSGFCNCSLTWDSTRFRTTVDAVINHVGKARRVQKMGVGFTRG